MAKRRGSQFARALTQTNLSDLGRLAGNLVYSLGKRSILPRIAAEVGAAQSSIMSIAEAKAYDEVGRTEITAALNSMWSEQPKQNLQILAALYETHPWVNICSSWIAEALAGVPLRIHKAVGFEDGKEILENADDSPVGRMFRWINPQQSPVEFNRDLALWLLLTGEGYIVHTDPGPGSPQGIPHELYVLFTPFVEKVVSPVHGIIGYNYNVSGDVVFLDASEVTYFKTFSPAGRFRGQGVATAGRQTIATDQQIRRFNANILNNGVHLSGVLETEEDMGKEEAGVVRDSFNTQYGGPKQGGRVAVLWGGLKFSPQTILQKDIMMTEQQQVARDEIIALYHLKTELLTEKFANKATAETVRRMAYEDTVLGIWGKLISSVWDSTGLMRYDPDLRARYDTSEVPALQTSMKEKIDSGAVAISSGQWTINETREKIHSLPPIDGVEGDIVFVGGTPVANLLNPPQSTNPNQIDAPKGTALQKLLTASEAEFTVIDSKAQESEIVFARMRRTAENRLERGLRSVYREIGRKTRNATRSTVNVDMLADIEQIFFFDGRKSVVKTVGQDIGLAIDDAVELEMANMAKVGVEGLFDVKPVRALARLNSQEQRINKMMGREWSNLKGTISEGLQLGESQAKINQRVSGFFGGMRNNAATIARTEITPAINGATMDVAIAARDKGVDVVSVWVTTETERVRRPTVTNPRAKNHRQAHGLTIIPGEEIFTVSGQKLEYPGDSWNGATADNTINCECGVRNEVRELSESDERGNL